MRLLLVEDDPRIAADIERALSAAGYVVETARDGEDAWFRGDTEDYGAIILDLGLPGMDGLAVLKRWRANGRHMPVLVLTARASWAERVDGIDAGADDYLPKPFRIEELLARLRSIVRRSAGHASSVVCAGDITLDERQMRVSVRGVPVTMSPLEYRLVTYLLRHRGRRRGLVRFVDVGEQRKAGRRAHPRQRGEPVVEAGTPRRAGARPVRLVEGGLEADRDSEPLPEARQRLRGAQHHRVVLDHAGAGDQEGTGTEGEGAHARGAAPACCTAAPTIAERAGRGFPGSAFARARDGGGEPAWRPARGRV